MNKIITQKGFHIFEISKQELLLVQTTGAFGHVCDRCNQKLNENVFYLPALNYGVCEECYKDWMEHATYFPEDEAFMEMNEKNILELAHQLNFKISVVDETQKNQ